MGLTVRVWATHLKIGRISPRLQVTNMFQQVRQLLDLITKSVDALERTCSESNIELPSLDAPSQPAHSALWADPNAAEAIAVISAASLHLNAIVSPPENMVLNFTVAGVSLIDFDHDLNF